MSFYTPNNLKVRLDPDKLYPVILPLDIGGHLDNILLDLELWENLPNAISIVIALITAYYTKSWSITLMYSFIGFFIGLLIQEILYSDIIRIFFPMFLGSRLIALPLTIIASILLLNEGLIICAITLFLIVLANLLNLVSVLLFFWSPISILFIKSTGLGVIERNFIEICNKRAKKLGITLNWNLYNKDTQNTQY